MLVNLENFDAAIEKIQETTDLIIVDTETTGLDVWNEHQMCGIGVCLEDETTFYFPFRHISPDMPILALLETEEINLPIAKKDILFKAINRFSVIIGHNIKFDLAVLHKEGFRLKEKNTLEDTIGGARLYFPDKDSPLNLEFVSERLIGTEMRGRGFDFENWKAKFKTYLKAHKITNYASADPELMASYCENDCLFTYKIRNKIIEFLKQTGQIGVYEQECELLKILFQMECEGLYFDRPYLEQAIPKLQIKLEEVAQKIYGLCGEEFDILSGKQLNIILNKMGYYSKNISEAGNPKWGLPELLGLDIEFANIVIEYRGIDKMLGTYFTPLLKWEDDRQHCSYLPWGTSTGRLSCRSPNLQNLSNKIQELGDVAMDEAQLSAIKAMMGAQQGVNVDMGKSGGLSLAGMLSYGKTVENDESTVSVRRLYIAPSDYTLLLIDFSQMEMRVFSDYVGDETVLEALENETFDFHDHVTSQVWGIEKIDKMWNFYRNLAKAINFGLVYGIGNKKLASQIQKTEEEAVSYRRQYFKRFPKAEIFINKVKRTVEQRGFVKNRYERRYYIPADKSYIAINYLVQGSSADIVKNRMIAINRFLKERKVKSKMIIQVHDELGFYIHKDEFSIIPEIQKIMEARQIKTRLSTDMTLAQPSWAHKKKLCNKCWGVKKKDEEHSCDDKNLEYPIGRKL